MEETSAIPISPLYPPLVAAPLSSSQIETTQVPERQVLLATFTLTALELAVITLDFRLLSSYDQSFLFDRDWELRFQVSAEPVKPKCSNNSQTVPLPEGFLDLENKFTVNEFKLQARSTINFCMQILIKNATFYFTQYLFYNTTSVEKIYPYRSYYENREHKTFAAVMLEDTQINIPINVPNIQEGSYPDHILDLILHSNQNLSKHSLINGVNYFSSPSLYWANAGKGVVVDYLPLFSNCKNYGSHIPIFSLFEQHPLCNLYSEDETVPIHQIKFGSKAIGDTCEGIKIDCIYDESLGFGGSLDNWFEAEGTVFYMTKTPLTEQEMTQKVAFDPQDYVEVKVENTAFKR